MKIMNRIVVTAVIAAMVSGCASGGGGGGTATATYADGSTRVLTLQEFLGCLLTAGLLCPRSANRSTPTTSAALTGSTSTTSANASSPTKSVWSWESRIGSTSKVSGRSAVVGYDLATDSPAQNRNGNWSITYSSITVVTGADGKLLSYGNSDHTLVVNGSGLPGHPGFAVAVTPGTAADGSSPFLDVEGLAIPGFGAGAGASQIGVVADPYQQGWRYQSFGLWNEQGPSVGRVESQAFGAVTLPGAVPYIGTATFSGKLAGFYVSPGGEGSIAAADVSVLADFSARALTLSSTGTALTRNLSTPVAAPGLDLHGTMTYSTPSSQFEGRLESASGTLHGVTYGSFYGPNGEELGGIVRLTGGSTSESFTGAYGAKR